MSSFELQIYKNGEWIVDSYYDDSDLVKSEADRLEANGRHAGIRILREEYHEETNTSNYQILYTRMKKDAAKKEDRRIKTKRETTQATGRGKTPGTPRTPRTPPPTKSGGKSVMMPVLIAVLLLVVGVGAMFAIESDAINEIVGGKSR